MFFIAMQNTGRRGPVQQQLQTKKTRLHFLQEEKGALKESFKETKVGWMVSANKLLAP